MNAQVKEEEKAPAGTDYFRSYYEDYTLTEVLGPDGIVRNEFVYGGKLYGVPVSHGAHIRLKLAHSALFCVTLLCIVLSNLSPAALNLSKIAAAPMFALIFLTVLRFFALVFYWLSPLEMREWDYKRGPKRLRNISLLCALACLALFLVYLALMAATGEFTAAVAALILLQIPGGLSAFASYAIERRLKYSIRQSV
ncbi:MAG: hypothetical protein ACI3XJ_03520 [Oscillospiraceae bacterium]